MDDKKELAKKLLNRLEALESSTERRKWEQEVRDIAKYVQPRREIFEEGDAGGGIGSSVYDPTAVMAARTMADGMQGHLVSSRSKWFRRRTGLYDGDTPLDEFPQNRTWLQRVERVEYTDLQVSNFYQAMNQFFLDAVSIGTAVIYGEWNWERDCSVFLTRNPREYYLEENEYEEVEAIFRKFKMPAGVAVELFEFDSQVQEMAERNPTQKIELIHAVYPRTRRDIKKITNVNKKYASVYLYRGGQHGPQVLRESGYDLFPYSVWRFYKNPGEVYGKSPAWELLDSIKLVNQMQKALIKGAQLAIDPPWALPKKWKNFRNIPGARNFYDVDPKQIGYPMQTNVNGIPITLENIQDLRNMINEHYRVQFFAMLANTDKEMTATEIMERQGEKATLLGPSVGRLNSSALLPMMDLHYHMLLEAGKIPPPPEELMQYAGADLKIDFVGPLAQAQEMYLGSQPLKRYMNSMLPYAQFFPEILDNVNPDELNDELAQAAGVSQQVLRTPQERAQMRMQRQQQQMAAAQAQMQNMGADTAQKLGKAPEPGSPAEAMMNQSQDFITPGA